MSHTLQSLTASLRSKIYDIDARLSASLSHYIVPHGNDSSTDWGFQVASLFSCGSPFVFLTMFLSSLSIIY